MLIVIGFASQMRLAIFKCFRALTMLLAALIKGSGEGGGHSHSHSHSHRSPPVSPLFSSSHCLLTLAWNRLSYGEVGWA